MLSAETVFWVISRFVAVLRPTLIETVHRFLKAHEPPKQGDANVASIVSSLHSHMV